MRTLNILLLLSSLLVLSSCGGKKEAKTEEATFVKVERVTDYIQNDKLVFNGKIKEQKLSTLSFRVAGPLKQLNVESGQFVKKGDIIAAIDKRDYRLKLQSAKAQFTQTKGEYKRYKELYEKGKVPANSYEKLESGYNLAEANYNAALNALNDTELKAPFTGYIYKKFTENFQTVGAGQPIVSMIDVSKLEVEISIAENLLQKVNNSNIMVLSVENAKTDHIPLQLVSMSEKAESDGLFKAKYSFINNDSLNIVPGMSAEITMYNNTQKESTRISASALFHKENDNFVWVYNNKTGTISQRKVTIGQIGSDGKIEIRSGLQPNEIIVTAGVYSLYDNQAVKPIQKPSATNIGGLL